MPRYRVFPQIRPYIEARFVSAHTVKSTPRPPPAPARLKLKFRSPIFSHFFLDNWLLLPYSSSWVTLRLEARSASIPAGVFCFAPWMPILLNGVFVAPTKFCRYVSLFRINTYKSASKQRTLSAFRMNTCEKRGGGGRRLS